jgi:hypothetical protein
LPVASRAGVHVVGDLLARHTQQPKETVEDCGWVGGRLGGVGVEPAEVDKQHSVEWLVTGE